LGIGEGAGEVREKLASALQGFVERMGQAVEKAVTNVATLEVLTYTADDISQVKRDDLDSSAALRAITRIKPDGDIEACVPAKEGAIDEDLWSLHADLVQQAQANRAELVRTAFETITGLLKVT
jgi:hypothetical protein